MTSEHGHEGSETELPVDEEREAKVKARRERQSGSKNKPFKVTWPMIALMMLFGGVVVYMTMGEMPTKVEEATSHEALTIDNEVAVVEEPAATPQEMVIPPSDWKEEAKDKQQTENDRIAQLEAQLAELTDQKPSGSDADLSDADAQIAKSEGGDGLAGGSELSNYSEQQQRQILSTGLVFDGTEDAATSGQNELNAGQAAGTVVEDQRASDDEQFLQAATNSGVEVASAQKLGDLSRVIVQGTMITAALDTAINTELPGAIRATVTNDVFSHDGSKVLLPSGSRLIGTFNTDVNTAQKRVLIAWNRAITPQGVSVALGAYGADQYGRSGVEGKVDRRLGERYGGALLISMISALPNIANNLLTGGKGGGNANNNNNNSVGSELANGLSGGNDVLTSSIQERVDLKPIINIKQGTEIKIFVNRDLIF